MKQYAGYSPPKASLGSHTLGKTTFGYKVAAPVWRCHPAQTPGYGTSFGTDFSNGIGRYQSKPGFSKKALGLGVGAGFLAGAGLGAAGTLATYSAYHRYLAGGLIGSCRILCRSN